MPPAFIQPVFAPKHSSLSTNHSCGLTKPHAPIANRLPSRLSSRLPSRLPTPRPSTRPTMTIAEGDAAPDFTATDTDGSTITAASLRGSKVVLYFSNTAGPGCVSQSCSFRDAEAQFSALNARIVAVSAQKPAAAAEFKRANNLAFPVISDHGRDLQKLFGVPSTFGLLPGRVTFIIDREGVVRRVHNSQFSVGSHIDIAKEVLESLA